MRANFLYRISRLFGPFGLALGLLGGGVFAAAGQVQVAASKGTEKAALEGGAAINETSGPIQGPILGYVFEQPRNQLKPILGIAGSSHIGDVVPLGLAVQAARVSPQQDYLLAIEAGSGKACLFGLQSGQASEMELEGLAAGADRIVLSTTGEAAALYDRQSRRVQLVSGLPNQPQVEDPVSVGSLPGLITAMAVDDEGGTLLVAVVEQEAGGIYALAPGGGARRIAPAARVSSIAFLDGSQDALVADYGRNEILLIRDVNGSPQTTLLASEQDGIQRPTAVAARSDGRRAVAASSHSGEIAFLPIAGGAPGLIDCNCKPTGLERLRGGTVFRLTEASSEPVLLLDASSEDPRILFVPPSSSESSAPPDEREPARTPRGGARQ